MFLRDVGREGTTLPTTCLPAHDIAADYLFYCGGCVLAELKSRCVDQRLGLTRCNRTVALNPLIRHRCNPMAAVLSSALSSYHI
jgi:hypothetical protein